MFERLRKSLRNSANAIAVVGGLVTGGLLAWSAYSATTLHAFISTGIKADYSVGTNLGNTPIFQLPNSATPQIELTAGTGSGQADQIFADTRTLAASATETHDLAGSGASLHDPFGASLSFARIKVVRISAACGNTNNVVVGNAASNQFAGPVSAATATTTLPPCGVLVWIAPNSGWAITDSSNDLFKVANSSSGTGVTYTIVIIGASA